MKTISVIIGLFLVLITPLSLFATDIYKPFKNAKSVVMKGPNISGTSPYGLATVKTHDGKCYQYLTDKGQFIKYKKCEDSKWIIIPHNIVTQ